MMQAAARQATIARTGVPASYDEGLQPLSAKAEDALADLARVVRHSDNQQVAAIVLRQLAAQLAVLNVRDWLPPTRDVVELVAAEKARAARP